MSNYAYRDIERKIVLYSSQAIKRIEMRLFIAPIRNAKLNFTFVL